MFNRSEIMKAAWRHYRTTFTRSWIKAPVDRAKFAFCLACVWQRAKEALMTPQDRRADAIRGQIDALKYKSFQINIEPRRLALERELASLAG